MPEHKVKIFTSKIVFVFILGKTGRTGILIIQNHKENYKNGELKTKFVCEALGTDHTPNF